MAAEIVIRDERSGDRTTSISARIDDQGRFQLASVEAGPDIKRATGDWDDEAWIHVEPEHHDRLLLALARAVTLAEGGTLGAFGKWLDREGVPNRVTRYT